MTDAAPPDQAIPSSLAQYAASILDRHTPAWLIVDERFRIQDHSAGIERFLAQTKDITNLNLLGLIDQSLAAELHKALEVAKVKKQPYSLLPHMLLSNQELVKTTITVEPLVSGHEEFHLLVLFQETENPVAQSTFHTSEEWFRMMVRTVPAILFTVSSSLHCDYVNQRFYEITGMPEGSALGVGWQTAIHPDDLDETREYCRRSRESTQPFEIICRLFTAGGSDNYRWVMVRAEPMMMPNGRVRRWFGSALDIHEHKLAEDRQRLLMAELQHRVKNILALIRSIFSRTFDADATATEHFRGRLDALARMQNVLARTPDSSIDLEDLVRDELLSHGALDMDRITVSGPAIRLRQRMAEALGLAIHELAANAVKYGALSNRQGHLSVCWNVQDKGAFPRLSWEWLEHGAQQPLEPPTYSGFGRELVEEGLPYELGATTSFEFTPQGVRCLIEMPLVEPISGSALCATANGRQHV